MWPMIVHDSISISRQLISSTHYQVCDHVHIEINYIITEHIAVNNYIPYVGKFWRINASKTFGVENFGESALSRSKNPTREPVSSVSVSSAC